MDPEIREVRAKLAVVEEDVLRCAWAGGGAEEAAEAAAGGERVAAPLPDPQQQRPAEEGGPTAGEGGPTAEEGGPTAGEGIVAAAREGGDAEQR